MFVFLYSQNLQRLRRWKRTRTPSSLIRSDLTLLPVSRCVCYCVMFTGWLESNQKWFIISLYCWDSLQCTLPPVCVSILSLVLSSLLSIQSSVPVLHLHFTSLMLSDSCLAIPCIICCRRRRRMKLRSPVSLQKSLQRQRRKRMRQQRNLSHRKRKRVRGENPRQQVQTLTATAAPNAHGFAWNLTQAYFSCSAVATPLSTYWT